MEITSCFLRGIWDYLDERGEIKKGFLREISIVVDNKRKGLVKVIGIVVRKKGVWVFI